ncbi:WD40 repeat domain-containing protein [Halomonas sp. GXIMD04776]|uniref:WD40 repeat domain-containing protein n=1 Tax=Halomonas sp. GXIMD04776 TaxID=3415605 RepID=UPI003CAEEE97
MVLGISSDGRYAISTHLSKHLVLWDLEQRQRKILSTNANIYSAYFIHERDAFLWQDLDNKVRVQTIDGEVLQQFAHFPTYGHVMNTSLEHYIASDDEWNLFHGHGNAMQTILSDGDVPGVVSAGKLLHISLSEERGLFTTAGYDNRERFDLEKHPPIVKGQSFGNYGGVFLWDIETLKPIAQLPGNNVKVDAAISPDGQWVVTGDENTIGLFWNTQAPEESFDMAASGLGVFKRDSKLPVGDPRKWDDSRLISAPEDYTDTTVALAFINDSQEFLRFGYRSHWVALFEAGNPWPQKYFDLGDDPHPSTASYLRSLSIATSPQAKVLVTGHHDDGGITVYRYDPEARTLNKEWVGE